MTAELTVRRADRADVPAILEIYNEAVVNTTASYDLVPVSLESRLTWFDHKQGTGWPVLVAEQETHVVGWATFGPYRDKAGYAGTVEHSVYVQAGGRGSGVGRALMAPLIAEARARGLHVMLGAVDAENAASIRFHQSFGFVVAGQLSQVGRKFDRWLDVVFMQLMLQEPATTS
ncbi:phosphinothricin acetyltransferase [Deinococcus malanensis]|uniref:Phosphinothricin acetyltransferase n=1 Tax=Deinococcus malanensis TaxID=1706855 RepID=A0ABQ2ETG9_9DEIO|nr:GNAT family N-acetyltransferase [Deinococcus malanensis]GGK19968.1 phosphinothricin acetyltransferase [Deinococcus malanensis]